MEVGGCQIGAGTCDDAFGAGTGAGPKPAGIGAGAVTGPTAVGIGGRSGSAGGVDRAPNSPTRLSFCQRSRTPASAVPIDLISTAYIICR